MELNSEQKENKEALSVSCLVFQPVHQCFKKITCSNKIIAWKSKGLTDEKNKPPATFDNSLSLGMLCSDTRFRVKFDVSCFMEENIPFTHKTLVTFYINYEINFW